jgi:hypothetical protein
VPATLALCAGCGGSSTPTKTPAPRPTVESAQPSPARRAPSLTRADAVRAVRRSAAVPPGPIRRIDCSSTPNNGWNCAIAYRQRRRVVHCHVRGHPHSDEVDAVACLDD